MIRINFVGDVAIFKEYENRQHDPFAYIKLPDSSFNVANFEFPLPDSNAIKLFYDVDNNYRVSDSFGRSLQLDKFDLYSLANNHIQDYGTEGILSTIDKIVSARSNYFGVGKDQFNTFSCDIDGISFLFIAFVKKGRWDRRDGDIGPDSYDLKELLALIESRQAMQDHIVVFPHWGTELVDSPDPEDVINARQMIDAGASCVIGHHPHIPQGCEIYKNGLIVYSLGSFIYLPDYEKGNTDKLFARDVSICLNVEFSKKSIVGYTPYKYVLDRFKLTPVCQGDFRSEKDYEILCAVIGDARYYSKKVRSVLLRRELVSFFSRFKEDPLRATSHYLQYVKLNHFKKIIGLH